MVKICYGYPLGDCLLLISNIRSLQWLALWNHKNSYDGCKNMEV